MFMFGYMNDKRGGISCVICSKWWSDLSECILNITGVSSVGKMLTPPLDQGVKSGEVSSTHGSIIMDTDILLCV